MNLLHLEQFYEVAKAGSVSTGARKLRLSQPAISKSIRLLEESLGAKLFERTKRGVHLTASGRIAFEHASRIFSEARSLSDRIETEKSALSGEWCLGASDNLAIHLLPPVIARMKRLHPELRLQLFSGTSGAIKEELYSDRCDAGLFFTPPASSEPLRYEQVAETEFWVVLASRGEWTKKIGKARAKGWTVADLRAARVPQIESRHQDYAAGFPAQSHSRDLGLNDSRWIEANLHEVKKRLVMAGAGFGILTRPTVEREVKEGTLVRVASPAKLAAPVYWVTRKSRPLHPASAEFLRIARALGTFESAES